MAGMPMLIGTLASVLLIAYVGVSPNASDAAVADWTIGELAGVSPHGRSPMSFGSTAIFPSAVDRARFSSSTASRTTARKASSSFLSSAHASERMSTSMLTSKGIELTEVPPRTTPTLKVVFGSPAP